MMIKSVERFTVGSNYAKQSRSVIQILLYLITIAMDSAGTIPWAINRRTLITR